MMYMSPAILSAMVLGSLCLGIIPAAYYLAMSNQIFLLEWPFFSSSSSPIIVNIILDPYGLLFCLTVLFISTNVMIFTNSYMKEDPFLKRFTHLVLLFVLSMNFLIFIPHLISLLIGWDGLGLTSFLLVIYYQNPKSLAAGMITALMNRIGDVLILISIALALNASHWNIMYFWHSPFSSFLAISIMVAAMTKSAQIPFSSWLPAAMAAPTPVSALVHSSTLVTAGVFLLFRFYPFLSSSKLFSQALLIISVLTTLMAGLSAMTECDMKKIIALSTLSQLGVMMTSLAMGAPILAFFHLVTHALFKALLFLCAGTLIHIHHHSQDLRFMGNISQQIPSITSPLLIANLALCGAPFLAGFYSKDMILEFALFNPMNSLFIFLFFFATGLTASYTARFLLAVVWSPNSSLPLHPTNDNDFFCSLPTFLLSTGAITAGSLLSWTMLTPSSEFFLPPHLKYLTLAVTLLGFSLSWIFNSSLSSSSAMLKTFPTINYSACFMWFLTPLTSQNMLHTPFSMAHLFSKSLDNGWEELIGGQGALILSTSSTSNVQLSQDNSIMIHLTLGTLIIPLTLLLTL